MAKKAARTQASSSWLSRNVEARRCRQCRSFGGYDPERGVGYCQKRAWTEVEEIYVDDDAGCCQFYEYDPGWREKLGLAKEGRV